MAIAYSNVSGANQAGGTITISQTIGSETGRILVVGVSSEGATNSTNYCPNSVTFGGVSLTKIISQDYGTFALDNSLDNQSLWYLINPATGTANISISFPNAVTGASAIGVQLSGAAQQAPEAVASVGQQNTGAATCNITTLTNNSMIVDLLSCNYSTVDCVASAGQTELLRLSNLQDCEMSVKPVATAGATTTGWSASGNTSSLGIVAAAFAELTGSTTHSGSANEPASAGSNESATALLSASSSEPATADATQSAALLAAAAASEPAAAQDTVSAVVSSGSVTYSASSSEPASAASTQTAALTAGGSVSEPAAAGSTQSATVILNAVIAELAAAADAAYYSAPVTELAEGFRMPAETIGFILPAEITSATLPAETVGFYATR